MGQPLRYLRTYANKKLDKAYRLFVDSRASQREIPDLTGISRSTINRYSTRDQWNAERTTRSEFQAKREQEIAETIAGEAAVAPDGADATPVTPDPLDPRPVLLRVMKRQQRLFDRIEEQAVKIVDAEISKAEETGKAVSIGRLMPIIALAEKICSNVRRAYGIPDVTKSISELTGANGEPLIPKNELSDTERAAGILAVLQSAGARAARRPDPGPEPVGVAARSADERSH